MLQTATNWSEPLTPETTPSEYVKLIVRDVRALYKILQRYIQESVTPVRLTRTAGVAASRAFTSACSGANARTPR